MLRSCPRWRPPPRLGPMDDELLKRLHVRPEGSAFAHYARTLRLLSGLNGVGLVRALARAKLRKDEVQRELELRSDPSVVSFVRFLESVPAEDRPVVLSVISDGLFPGVKTGWFSAGCPDPLVSPSAALSFVQENADEVLTDLSPLVPPLPPAPVHQWQDDVVPHEQWADDVVTAVLSQDFCGDSTGAPMALPAEDVRKIKVELLADGNKISFERFVLQRKACAKHLMQAIELGFSGCLVGVHGTLFERLHNREVPLDVVLATDLSEVTLFELHVSWKVLLDKNGLEKLVSSFDVPEDLARISEVVKNTVVVPIDTVVGDQVLLSQELTVPKVAKIGDIKQAIESAYKNFFDGVRNYVRHHESEDPLDDHLSVVHLGTAPIHLVFQVSLHELLQRHGRKEIIDTFPMLDLEDEPKVAKEDGASCFIDVDIIADGCYTLCEKRFLVPFERSSKDGTAEALVQCIISTFGRVLASGKGFLTTTDGGRIRNDTVLADKFPSQRTFAYHVELSDLLLSNSPQGLRETFPDAESLRHPSRFPEVEAVLDRHCRAYGPHRSVLTEVGLSESVPLQTRRLDAEDDIHSNVVDHGNDESVVPTGEGAPVSKAKPASPRTSDQDQEKDVVVLKVRLFIDTQHLMLRYEKVYPDTTGSDVKQRLWAKLPEQYRNLDCELLETHAFSLSFRRRFLTICVLWSLS